MHPSYLDDPDSYRGQYDVYDLDADPEPLPEVVSEKPDDDAADEDGK